VTVRSEAGVDEVTLSVRDEGVGIREQDQVKVFGRFYRAPNTAAQHPGTGIGLAIVKQFVEAQDGRVTLSSTPGAGSEFTLYLRSGPSRPDDT
jgi:two-component system sensor histidine kinase BaeS